MASKRARWASVPAAAIVVAAPMAAHATAATPTISGNVWVAYAIIAALVFTIYLLIMGALHVERRDARLGRAARRDDGWFGIFPLGSADDEDSPDFHHHGGGDGGEGGEGGEGGWG
jgi:hypothetical protein